MAQKIKLIRWLKGLNPKASNSDFYSIKQETIYSFIGKFTTMAAGLLVIPLLINAIDSVRFGVWQTVTSVVQSAMLLDFGLANGLRNKFTEAKAKNDLILASKYLSTSYALLIIVSLVFLLLYFSVSFFFKLEKIFNTPLYLLSEVKSLLTIIFCFQTIRLVLDIVITYLIADLKPGRASIINGIISLTILPLIIVVERFSKITLVSLGFIYSIPAIIILLISSFYIYNKESAIKPSLSKIDFKLCKDILNLGLKFFIIQIVALIIFTTDNIIISNLFEPSLVTPYNITYKYFLIVTFGFNIIITPFWSAFNNAYSNKKYDWIEEKVIKLIKIWGLFLIFSLMLLLCAPYIYFYWVGSKVQIPFLLSLSMCLFTAISNWNNIFAFFLNGVSKIKMQLYTSIFIAIVNIPLSYFFAKNCSMGVAGVVFANCTCLFFCSILQPIQYKKIIKGTAKGIWNK